MHILILPSWYFPSGSQEIAGRMVHHLAKGLRDERIDARVLYASYSPKGPMFKKSAFIEEEGVPTWRSDQFFPPKGNYLLMKMWINLYVKDIVSYIRKEGRPDLIHAHSYLAASVCAALQEEVHIPFIYTERLSTFILGTVPKYHTPFLPGCFEKASVITCVSPGLLDRMQPHTRKNIQVIPNFFDEKIFYPEPGIRKSDPFTWVSIGEPAHIKGLDLLLRAYAALKEKCSDVPMQLVLIDRIPEKESLLRLAESLGIADQLVWKGLISPQEIAAILRTSHALISASRVETFGKAIIEAQACGLPVVATRTDGARYIISTAQQGELAATGSPEALTNAMGKMFAQFDSYDAGYISNFIRKRFSSTVVIAHWINCYKSVLS